MLGPLLAMPSGQGLNMTLLAILKVNRANYFWYWRKNWSWEKSFHYCHVGSTIGHALWARSEHDSFGNTKVNRANWLLVLEKNWSCGKMFLLLTRYHYWSDNIRRFSRKTSRVFHIYEMFYDVFICFPEAIPMMILFNPIKITKTINGAPIRWIPSAWGWKIHQKKGGFFPGKVIYKNGKFHEISHCMFDYRRVLGIAIRSLFNLFFVGENTDPTLNRYDGKNNNQHETSRLLILWNSVWPRSTDLSSEFAAGFFFDPSQLFLSFLSLREAKKLTRGFKLTRWFQTISNIIKHLSPLTTINHH